MSEKTTSELSRRKLLASTATTLGAATGLSTVASGSEPGSGSTYGDVDLFATKRFHELKGYDSFDTFTGYGDDLADVWPDDAFEDGGYDFGFRNSLDRPPAPDESASLPILADEYNEWLSNNATFWDWNDAAIVFDYIPELDGTGVARGTVGHHERTGLINVAAINTDLRLGPWYRRVDLYAAHELGHLLGGSHEIADVEPTGRGTCGATMMYSDPDLDDSGRDCYLGEIFHRFSNDNVGQMKSMLQENV